MPAEPPGNEQHIKVSLRLPSGERITKRFLLTDPLERMFGVASALTMQPVSFVDLAMQFSGRSLREVD
eukprot:689314-Prorocentrum_lima.AAC.1